jgi:hypothetical protein
MLEFVRQSDRADSGAIAAGGAFAEIYIARLIADLYLEVPFFAADAFEIRIREEIYVQMPADLDQLGGDNSHGALICGEGLVELCHSTTNSRALFQQMHIIARIGKIKGSLHPGNSSTDHQN